MSHVVDAQAAAALDPELLRLATNGLKKLAADTRCRSAFVDNPLMAALLAPAANRYIVAADQDGLFERLPVLEAKGYRTGVEFVGEEARNADEVRDVVDEYLKLIERHQSAGLATPTQLGFDLSNVGSLISPQTGADNTAALLKAAAPQGIGILISMERSSFVDDILTVFKGLAEDHENVALTLQAHLHRTEDDLATVLPLGRKIRLVKGVYNEAPDVALPRGPELNDRYARILERILDHGNPVAVATHDATLLELLDSRGLLERVEELEMLHGCRPPLLKAHKDRGIPCRVATVYGQNWWLHFLHRLAEYPPVALTALADLYEPERVRFGSEY
ncbi:proline dehydrogenase family protein [Streptomyces sp. Ag109_G2-15]|uniref:proline dehydrogenase family protein n=1 Tax=Streptomyces sp. Ag109_G2-15 TaxID=1938850 RepID=UPI000BD05790|nr:proline dehydrogenase family protein [Streptomyces sp. Ag109_G2-15]SOD81026.1 L-proline dehydrogenase [Streptomyces sp. Ag109_G2-15]